MLVVISKFKVSENSTQPVAKAYQERPKQVDHYPGFLGLEVLRPKEAKNEFWLITRWDSEDTFKKWFASHEFHKAHQAIPKGVCIEPGSHEIILFESWCH